MLAIGHKNWLSMTGRISTAILCTYDANPLSQRVTNACRLSTGPLDIIQVIGWWHLRHSLQKGRHISWAKLLQHQSSGRTHSSCLTRQRTKSNISESVLSWRGFPTWLTAWYAVLFVQLATLWNPKPISNLHSRHEATTARKFRQSFRGLHKLPARRNLQK